jgi:hypothetical protein
MRRAFLFSLAFHLAVLLVAYFGLPAASRDEALLSETALSVELVDVAEKSNIPPARQEKKVEPAESRSRASRPEPPSLHPPSGRRRRFRRRHRRRRSPNRRSRR